MFPGHFSEKKWREVLDAMHVLATSLERAAEPVRLGDS
jgi:hypothetical protein